MPTLNIYVSARLVFVLWYSHVEFTTNDTNSRSTCVLKLNENGKQNTNDNNNNKCIQCYRFFIITNKVDRGFENMRERLFSKIMCESNLYLLNGYTIVLIQWISQSHDF